VEGQKPADSAPQLGMSANSVSALAFRAREGLRQAFLTMHLSDISETECRWVNEHLGAYVRQGLSKRDTTKVQTHLEGCRRCTAMYLELTEVNSNLSAIIAPLLLGAAATGYVASTGGISAAGVVSTIAGRVRDVVVGNATAATAGAVAASVAAAAVVGISLTTGKAKEEVTSADRPAASSAPAAPKSSPVTPEGKKHGSQATTPATRPVTSTPPAFAAAASDVPATDTPVDYVPVPLPGGVAAPAAPAAQGGPGGNGSAGGPPASKPGTTDPGTSEPGTGEPGTSDPGTTDPGSGDPGSSDPGSGPSDPGTGPSEPGNGPDPAPQPPPAPNPGPPPGGTTTVETELGFTTAPALVDGHLQVSLSAAALPPTFTATLSGDVAGITFGQDAADRCTPNGLVVTCTVVPTMLSSGGGGLPATAATSAVTADLPLKLDDSFDQYIERSLEVTLTLPEDYVANGSDSLVSTVDYLPSRSFDVGLAPLRSVPGDGTTFTVTATPDGPLPSVLSVVGYAVSAPENTRLTADGCTPASVVIQDGGESGFTCPAAGDGDQTFEVSLPETSAQPVSVRLLVPDGWTGTDTRQRIQELILDPAENTGGEPGGAGDSGDDNEAPATPFVVSVGDVRPLDADPSARWSIPVHLTGLRPSAALTLRLNGGDQARFDAASGLISGDAAGANAGPGCTLDNDPSELSCTGLTASTLDLTVVIFLAPGQPTETLSLTARNGEDPVDSATFVVGYPAPGNSSNSTEANGQDSVKRTGADPTGGALTSFAQAILR
jgi:hypothetical protein